MLVWVETNRNSIEVLWRVKTVFFKSYDYQDDKKTITTLNKNVFLVYIAETYQKIKILKSILSQ